MKKKVNNCVEIVERDEIVTIDVIKEENLMLNAKKWDLILRKGFLLWKKISYNWRYKRQRPLYRN